MKVFYLLAFVWIADGDIHSDGYRSAHEMPCRTPVEAWMENPETHNTSDKTMILVGCYKITNDSVELVGPTAQEPASWMMNVPAGLMTSGAAVDGMHPSGRDH